MLRPHALAAVAPEGRGGGSARRPPTPPPLHHHLHIIAAPLRTIHRRARLPALRHSPTDPRDQRGRPSPPIRRGRLPLTPSLLPFPSPTATHNTCPIVAAEVEDGGSHTNASRRRLSCSARATTTAARAEPPPSPRCRARSDLPTDAAASRRHRLPPAAAQLPSARRGRRARRRLPRERRGEEVRERGLRN